MKKYLILIFIIAGGLILAPKAHAERLVSLGFELATSTTGFEVTQAGLGTSNGTEGVTTTVVRSGIYSMRMDASQGGTSGHFSWFRQAYRTANSTATSSVRAYFYFTAFPTSTVDDLFAWTNTAATINIPVRINSSGQLTMYDQAGTKQGATSTALSLNTWYRIEEQVNGLGAGTATMSLLVDGTTVATTTTATNQTIAQIYFGPALGNAGSWAGYLDDIAFNDATGSNQTGVPGAGQLILYRPGSTGDVNNWLQTGGAASSTTNWQNVDDIPPQGAVYNEARATSTQDLYGVVATSTLPANSTINTVQVGVRYGGSATTVPSFQAMIEKTSGGTIASGTIIAPAATALRTNQNTSAAGPYTLTASVDPDGAAWTNTTIGTMQIGLNVTKSQPTNFARVVTEWAYVDYTASTAPVAGPAVTSTYLIVKGGLIVKGIFIVR